MKVLFCGYRDWATSVFFGFITEHQIPDVEFTLVSTPDELSIQTKHFNYDLIVVVGWSWKISTEIVDTNVVIGMHPSKLPEYAGGSPIQHQIIDGLKASEATLFRLTSKLDGGDIVSSAPYSLEGHMSQVFDELTRVTTQLLIDLIVSWPNVSYKRQEPSVIRRRLKPEDSCLSKEKLSSQTCASLYDTIRCREDPYPNVYIEDETGRLTFKIVEFEPKK